MRHGLSWGVAALVVGWSGSALSGVVVTSNQTNLDTKKVDPTTVYIDTDRMKLVNADNIMIFRGDLNRVWMIEPQKKSYMEWTPETMQQMAGQVAGASAQMAAAMAQMQAEMAKLPPEQRAQMEAMMAGRGGLAGLAGGRGGAPAAPQVSYTRAGGSKTVAGWSCDQYRKTVNGQQEEDLCIARIAATGFSQADFQVFERFSNFMSPIMSQPSVPKSDIMNWTDMNKAIGFQGVPLDTVMYSGGRPNMQQTVNKAERTAIPASTYELPTGLTKQDISAMFGARGGRGPR
ncbi:MAG: hypothetical protein QOF03_597 [Alphaproteobacteria bacterium]|jgi:hypothetical protein|nr:hypothetical protein [Alphaproteobacteria bacterium]